MLKEPHPQIGKRGTFLNFILKIKKKIGNKFIRKKIWETIFVRQYEENVGKLFLPFLAKKASETTLGSFRNAAK